MDIDLGYAIGLPPEAAVEYFRSKGYTIAWDWRDTWREVNTRRFTVAKAMQMDILQDIRRGVDKALAQGLTERMFQRDMEPLLRARGWWGRQEMVDPTTGEARKVSLGSAYRLNTIYRANLQSAYMVGRYRSQAANMATRPFWQYVAVMDGRTRPGHAALHGRVFRADDPIWGRVYPPNGFRCRCRVRALTLAEVERRGLQVDTSEGHAEEIELPDGSGGTAGSVSLRVPGMDRAFVPDPGWDYNPGQAWGRRDRGGMLPECGEADFAEGGRCLRLAPGQRTWRDLGLTDLRLVGPALRSPSPVLLPKAADAVTALAVVRQVLGVGPDDPWRVVETPAGPVVIRDDLLPHLVEKRDHARERYAHYFLPTLTDPFEVWLTAYEDGYRKRYIGLFQGARDLLAVARENRDGALLWNVIRMDDVKLNNQRVGVPVWQKR